MNDINAELLFEVITQKGLTYSKVSENLNVSRSTIYNITVGRTSPSQHVLNSLVHSLEMTQKEFIAIFYPNIHFKKEF